MEIEIDTEYGVPYVSEALRKGHPENYSIPDDIWCAYQNHLKMTEVFRALFAEMQGVRQLEKAHKEEVDYLKAKLARTEAERATLHKRLLELEEKSICLL